MENTITPELQLQLDGIFKNQADISGRLELSEKENAELRKQLTFKNSSAPGDPGMKAQIDGIIKNQEESNLRLETSERENAELKKQLANLSGTGETEEKDETPKIPQETFTIGKKKYKFLVAKMIIPGLDERTALEILSDTKKNPEIGDKTVMQHLVDIKSGAIKEVTE